MHLHHCYGHALNLAVDEVKRISDSLETVREIMKLVTKWPQRNTTLDEIRAETQNQNESMISAQQGELYVVVVVLNNHMELMEL